MKKIFTLCTALILLLTCSVTLSACGKSSGDNKITTIGEFITEVSNLQGNFTVVLNEPFKSIFNVNGNVSCEIYSDDEKSWTSYNLIHNNNTYLGYTADDLTWERGFNLIYDYPTNIFDGYNFFYVFLDSYFTEADFSKSGKVYTLTLESIDLPYDETLTELIVEFMDDGSVEVTQTINATVYSFSVTFGTSAVKLSDLPPYTIA